jgi:plastocyanin
MRGNATRRARVLLAAGALAVATVGGFVPRAEAAAPALYFTGPGSPITGWTVPVVAVPAGAALTFVNIDVAPHNFVAEGAYGSDRAPWCKPGHYPKKRCPLFWSRTVGLAGSAPVVGLDHLVAGHTYTYVCTIHSSMRGTLVALPAAG